MGQEKFKNVAIEDYLAIEREDGIRYEYHGGELFTMAGGTLPHTDICNNVATTLTNLTRANGGKCKAFNSEMKIEVIPATKYLYPDAGVTCGERQESDIIKGAIKNPRLIVEVTSPSSGEYDRGKKLRWYFSLPSVKEYLIISQDEPLVMIYRKHGEGDLYGMQTVQGLEDLVELRSIDVQLPMAEIYYEVDFLNADR